MSASPEMENAGPLLSICIPAYNGARFLERVLEALLPQVLEANGEAEVLVIDDCSSDNTAEVVEQARGTGRFVTYATQAILAAPGTSSAVRCNTRRESLRACGVSIA